VLRARAGTWRRAPRGQAFRRTRTGHRAAPCGRQRRTTSRPRPSPGALGRAGKAMEPILTKLQTLRAGRDALEAPDDPHAAMRDAARERDEAEAAGDIAALRAMVRRAFPGLTLRPARPGGDRAPERFLRDGPRPPTR